MQTRIMPVTDLRRDTRAVIQAVNEDGDVVFITQYGRPAAVLIDPDYYESLLTNKNEAQQEGGWPPNFFKLTYGVLADDPIERHEQDMYPEREPIG